MTKSSSGFLAQKTCGLSQSPSPQRSGTPLNYPKLSIKVRQDMLGEAAATGNRSKLLKLLATNVDVNAEDSKSWTPLHWAAGFSRVEMAEILFRNRASLEVRDKIGRTPLLFAASLQRWEVVKYLIEKGANLQAQGNFGRITLHIAALRGIVDVIKACIREMGLDVNTVDNEGCTALHLAIMQNRTEAVDYLCRRAGVDVNIGTGYGSTALHVAAGKGFFSIALILVQQRCVLDKRDSRGLTPREIALRAGHYGVAQCFRGRSVSQLEVPIKPGKDFGNVCRMID